MEFYSFNTTKKYTKALLDTFNDIYTSRDSQYKRIPLIFASKDAAFVFSETESKQILSGNLNFLPRMSLSLDSITRDFSRDTNRLHKINKRINADNTISYQQNGVSYSFNYSLSIAARSLTELAWIYEQILPFFNPSLRLEIDELDGLVPPASIRVDLNNTQLSLPSEIDQNSIRIVESTLQLTLYGTLYHPIKDSALIKKVRLHYKIMFDENSTDDNTPSSITSEFDVSQDTHTMIPGSFTRHDFSNADSVGKNAPVLNSIEGSINNTVGMEYTYSLNYVDVDDERDFTYIYNILNDSADSYILHKNYANCTIKSNKSGSFTLLAQVIDKWGNQSNLTQKEIYVS